MNLINQFKLEYPSIKIPWQGYLRSALLNSVEYSLISELDDFNNEELYRAKLDEYLGLFNKLLSNINKLDVVQWSLYHLDELLSVDLADRLAKLVKLDELNNNLLQHLQNQDIYTHLSTQKLLTLSLSHTPSIQHLETLLHSIHQDIEQSSHLEFNTLLLTQLLNIRQTKQYTYTHILTHLLSTMSHPSTTPQITYNIIYSIWLVTFDKELCSNINSDHHIIPPLSNIAKSSIKEKVVRLILATFSNLLKYSKKSTLNTFLALPIQPTLTSLSSRRWSDDDLLNDLEQIQQQLTLSFASVSNWDEYASELDSGLLKWSPVHTDEEFWKNDGKALLNNGVWGITKLLNLLECEDAAVLYITLWDLAQFIKYITHAKNHIRPHHKSQIMQLLQHPDPKVKYQALVTTQLLISQPWNI